MFIIPGTSDLQKVNLIFPLS